MEEEAVEAVEAVGSPARGTLGSKATGRNAIERKAFDGKTPDKKAHVKEIAVIGRTNQNTQG